MKKKIKLKGHLRNYMYWPLMLTILLACMNVPMYFVNEGAALLVSIFYNIRIFIYRTSYSDYCYVHLVHCFEYIFYIFILSKYIYNIFI